MEIRTLFLCLTCCLTTIVRGNRIDEEYSILFLANLNSLVFGGNQSSSTTAAQNRTSHPNPPGSPTPHHLVEGDSDVVLFDVTSGEPLITGETLSNFFADEIVAVSRNPRVAKVLNASISFNGQNQSIENSTSLLNTTTPRPIALLDLANGRIRVALSVRISGHSIGKTAIDITVLGYRTSENETDGRQQQRRTAITIGRTGARESRVFGSFDVTVVRKSLYKTLGFVFTVFVAALNIFTTFLIGSKLDWRIVLKEIKKPKCLLLGLGMEFTMMPLLAFACAMLFLRGNYSWQVVFLAIGACPGGGHSPFWTMMLDGNLDLAVAMSFVANISALGILPFWLFTIGRTFYAGHVTIPFLTIMASLAGLVCPIFVGLLFKQYHPTWAERLGKFVKHMTVISFIVLAVFGCAVNSYVFALLDWRHLVCGLVLPWCGYAITYPTARWIFRRSYEDSVAICVENGCLNVAVPTVLIQMTLPQPDADLSLVVPVGVVIFASWPLWIFFIIRSIRKRMTMPVLPVQLPSAAIQREDSPCTPIEPRVTAVHRKSKDAGEPHTEITVTFSSASVPNKLPAFISNVESTGGQDQRSITPQVRDKTSDQI